MYMYIHGCSTHADSSVSYSWSSLYFRSSVTVISFMCSDTHYSVTSLHSRTIAVTLLHVLQCSHSRVLQHISHAQLYIKFGLLHTFYHQIIAPFCTYSNTWLYNACQHRMVALLHMTYILAQCLAYNIRWCCAVPTGTRVLMLHTIVEVKGSFGVYTACLADSFSDYNHTGQTVQKTSSDAPSSGCVLESRYTHIKCT